MTSARILVISISWTMLSAAPSFCAPDVKPPEAIAILLPQTTTQEVELQPQPIAGISLQSDSPSAPVIYTQDLSRYREFQFGMSLLAVTKRVDMKPSEARLIHQRPAVIQELEWRRARSVGSSPQGDPVTEVLFSFYNGELFRMVVNFDRNQTEGLTDEGMVEAISAQYGTATRPAAKIIYFSSFQVYNDSEKVIASWEDSQYSFNLFRSSYERTFGMLVFSKRLDALARGAKAEAIPLDKQEAPQREIEHQKRQAEESRVTTR